MLTDGTQRRETNFAAVRWNESATMGRTDPYRLFGPEHFHRFDPDQEDRGRPPRPGPAASRRSWPAPRRRTPTAGRPLRDRLAPRRRARRRPSRPPGARARQLDPTGQFWQVTFGAPTDLTQVTVAMPPTPPRSTSWSSGPATARSWRAAPGPAARAPTSLDVGDGATSCGSRRSAATWCSRARSRSPRCGCPGVPPSATSTCRCPTRTSRSTGHHHPRPGPVGLRARRRTPCRATTCWRSPGEDGDTLARRFSVPSPRPTARGTVSLRRTVDGCSLAARAWPATSDEAGPFDVAEGPIAMLDGDPGTTWLSQDGDETVTRPVPRHDRAEEHPGRGQPGPPPRGRRGSGSPPGPRPGRQPRRGRAR